MALTEIRGTPLEYYIWRCQIGITPEAFPDIGALLSPTVEQTLKHSN